MTETGTRAHVVICVVVGVLFARSPGLAQRLDVGLVCRGQHADRAADAFVSFVDLPAERRYREVPDPPPESLALLVTIDTDVPVIRVWRRSDGATLERRIAHTDDEQAYALALIASELLEVARSGADPAAAGATVVVAAPTQTTAPQASVDTVSAGAVPESDRTSEGLVPLAANRAPLAFTVGLALEAWLSVESDRPWLVQPTLWVELSGRPTVDGWALVAGLEAAGLGEWSRRDGELEGSYRRFDLALRVGLGGDVGPLTTRIFGHVRAGVSAVLGRARHSEGENERSAAAWFVGVALEGRQPLWEGLEVSFTLGADLLPAPARFTAFGSPLIEEARARLFGQLGLAWRIE